MKRGNAVGKGRCGPRRNDREAGEAAQRSGVVQVWDRRGNRWYYYRGQRQGGRVRRVYVGRGPAAEQAAAQDAARKAQRRATRAQSPPACGGRQGGPLLRNSLLLGADRTASRA